MHIEPSRNKLDAIYELREAVEHKARAEYELDARGTEAARDALLAAQLDVEAKTQDAIEVCHECGHRHAGEAALPAQAGAAAFPAHAGAWEPPDNVIQVDFRRDAG